jgi:hypothetical protein
MREKPTSTPIIHSVYELSMVAPTCFGITLPSSVSVPSALAYYIDCSSIEYLSEGNRNAPSRGSVMPKHVGATIHN